MRVPRLIALLGILAILRPALAEEGQLKVQRSTDVRGNPVIIIHETRPEVLARQRAQIQQAQVDRQSRKERELRLEIERLRAERDLVEAETRRKEARRAYSVTPRFAGPTRKKPSFFNGGLGRTRVDSWNGGFTGGFYGSSICAPRQTPVCR